MATHEKTFLHPLDIASSQDLDDAADDLEEDAAVMDERKPENNAAPFPAAAEQIIASHDNEKRSEIKAKKYSRSEITALEDRV